MSILPDVLKVMVCCILTGVEAAGRPLGLVGFGDIARHVAARASALGMDVIAHDPFVPDQHPVWREMRVEPVDGLEQILDFADVISLHVPYTPETANMIGAAALAAMRQDAILINTARGGIVDEDALIEALNNGAIGGAVLDVFAGEPVSADSGARFAGVPNLILTPHIAGVTGESTRWTSVLTMRNVLRVLEEES